MKQFFLIAAILFCVVNARATDPLTAPYVPSVDTNCAHAQYSTTSWLTDWTQKVRQDSGTNPGNACYLSGSTALHGTQNEFVDFQVHYHDSGSGTTGLKITVGNFVQSSPGSYTISSATTPPPKIIVYREAYMDVTIKSATSATFYNSTGYYPDILIPAVDPYWGQTTNAWPYTVSAGNNQSAWVDVLIPSGAPAGYYLGSVLVQSGCPGSCVTVATMPVVIAVWQWPSAGYMPATPTLKTEMSEFGYNGLCTQMYSPNSTSGTTLCNNYSTAGSNDEGVTLTDVDGDVLMKDHRFDSGISNNIYPQSGSFAYYTSLMGPVMGGSSYNSGCTHSTSYCAILPNSVDNTKEFQSAGNVYSAPIYSNWQSNFVTNGWGTAGTLPLFDYLCDEPPNGCSWATLIANASTRHGYLTPGIPELVTTDLVTATTNSAQNSIDILVVLTNVLEPQGGPLQNLANYVTWLSGSTDSIPRQFWGYNDCTSGGSCANNVVGTGVTHPNKAIDGYPAANRAMEWMLYLHGQSGELYYAADICMVPTSQGAFCGYPYMTTYDPWKSVYYSGMWGDGTLVYAGSTASCSGCGGNTSADNYMGAGVTTPLILPSLRLKLLRDGVQDYEYLFKLNALGYGSTVNTQLTSWITNTYTFETTGSGLNAARVALGNFMHALSYPAGQSSPAPSRSGLMLAKSGR